MSAMTEIPANTARPMGRTDSFFPGSVNVDCVVLADGAPLSAAAAAAVGLVLLAPLLAAVAVGFVDGVVGGGPLAGVGMT